ncbi:MAG TPA: sialidase family protein [Acidimicrobiales bacterium]|nr:sialidase family protein [Acidimicrobiales bacterium]
MERWRNRRALGGVLAAVAGVVLVVVAVQPRPAALERGNTVVVNLDRPGIAAHNSPAVAVHPRRPEVLVVADRIDTPRFSCSIWRSTNGGVTWESLPLPLAPEQPNCHAPDVAFTDTGDLLVLSTATGGRFNQPVGVWLHRFREDQPEGAPVVVAGPEAFHARLATEGTRVLVTWVQAGPAAAEVPLGFPPPPNPVVLARSDDGGRSFGSPVKVSADDRLLLQPTVLFGPGGRVVIGALDLGADHSDYEARHGGQGGPPSDEPWRVVSWTSDDRGATFGPAAVVADGVVPPSRIIVNLGPTPGFAWDMGSGRLYSVWDEGRADSRDVFLAHSDDAGQTWSPARAVLPRPGAQYLPAVGVAPGGRVDVAFYDRSADPADVLAEVTLASSNDGATTFVATTVSATAFDSRIGFGSAQDLPQLGSQLAVVSQEDRALSFWADTTRGSVATNIQDLAMAAVEVTEAQGPRWPLAATGGALLLVGAILAWRPMGVASVHAHRHLRQGRRGQDQHRGGVVPAPRPRRPPRRRRRL